MVIVVYPKLTALLQHGLMANFEQTFVAGGTYFFSVRLLDLQSDVLVRQVDLLRSSVRVCARRWPFAIDAAVILPSHLHMIWTLPAGDTDWAKRWRLIKSTFSRHLPALDDVPADRGFRSAHDVWQRGVQQHLIRDQQDFDLHMHQIHFAPVHAGLVRKPSDWQFCSLHARVVQRDQQPLRTTALVQSGQSPEAAVMSM